MAKLVMVVTSHTSVDRANRPDNRRVRAAGFAETEVWDKNAPTFVPGYRLDVAAGHVRHNLRLQQVRVGEFG
ncbi:hypothetical protein [Mycolicibacterium mageritense]|uniref:hypothetical protein n=1 Tax=Mycolicibacterium mageritense TaxID=53462 RepID=UPI0025729A02|nr:hypothetical protein [Mycolicibacterium mageritense]